MKVYKKLLAILLTICMILPFATSCSFGCDHKTEIYCNECGEIPLGDEYYANMLKSATSVIGKGKGFKLEASGSFTTTLEDESATFRYENEKGAYKYLVAPNVDATLTLDLTYGFDKEGKVYANGTADADAKMKDASGKTLLSFDIKLEKFNIIDNKLEYKAVADAKHPTLTKTEQEKNDYESKVEDSIDLEDSSTIANDILKRIIPSVLDAYTIDVAPYAVKLINANKKDLNEFTAKTLDSLCTLSKSGKNNVFTMTKLGGYIRNIPVLLDTDFSVVIDDTFGKDTYDKIPEKIEKILNAKLYKVIDDLKKKGVTIEEIVAVADEVCKKASGNDNSSLEELIGIDLVELVNGYDKNKTVKQLLIENGMTEKQINDYLEGIKEFLKEYKNKSVYEVINENTNANIGQEQKGKIEEIANAIGNYLDEVFTIKITADKDGNLISYEYGVKLNGESKATSDTLKIIDEFINFPYVGEGQITPEESRFNTIIDLIKSTKSNLTYKTTFVTIK